MSGNKFTGVVGIVAVLLLISACSVQQMAVNMISDALTGSGNNEVFLGDDDPQMVADSLPFAIKLYESLLQMNPYHRGLRLTTGSLYIMYANAFIQTPANMSGPGAYEKKYEYLLRAKKLYLRGRDMLSSYMETKYPGFSSVIGVEGDLNLLLSSLEAEDVEFFYWIGAAWFAAISIDSFDLNLSFRIPAVVALLERAHELDPDFNNGSLDELFIQMYAAIPESMGGSQEKAVASFERAIELQGGTSAGPYLSFATAVALPRQDLEMFTDLMNQALAIDADQYPEILLLNILAQKQARWYMDNLEEFFIM